jgi:ABC-type glycerol-3-phosphate transport system substrate-binding protein
MTGRARYVVVGGVVGAVTLLAGLIGGAGGFDPPAAYAASATDSGGAISVWVDAPRVPGVEAFEKSHPGIKVNLVTIPTADSDSQLEQKFVLDDEAGKGWPDAIFFPDNGDVAWASDSSINYTADLSKLVPSKILGGYDSATIGVCRIGGELRCLRNDTAPDVLWYNAKLFAQWGYTPPKTWEQYETLAVKIAKQHPGYVSGLLGDGYAVGRYLQGSGCPVSEPGATATTAIVDPQSPKCTRVVSMLQTLLAAKAVTPDGIFDSSAAALGSKIVMTPGAVWYGDYLFKDTFKVPAGEMTAAPSLYWSTDPTHITGDEGGGLYGLSNHIKGKELQNALTFVEWMVTAPAWQVDLSTGLPAYGPDRTLWLDKQNSDGYFADYPAMEKAILAAPSLAKNYAYLQYDPTAVWDDAMVPVVANHGSVTSGWKAFISQLINKAKSVGYSVSSS